MIISNSIKPQNTIYYLGAKLIQCIQSQPSKVLDSIILFEKFQTIVPSKVSFVQYMYALNWLFLLDLVEINDKGDIVICF